MGYGLRSKFLTGRGSHAKIESFPDDPTRSRLLTATDIPPKMDFFQRSYDKHSDYWSRSLRAFYCRLPETSSYSVSYFWASDG